MPATYVSFEGQTAGTAPAGWAQSAGSPFTVRAGSTISPSNGVGAASPADDQWAVYTAGPSAGDSAVQITQIMQRDVGSADWLFLGLVLRANAGFTNGYLCTWNPDGRTVLFYSKTGSTYTAVGSISSAGTGPSIANGGVVTARFECAGTTLRVKIWDAAGAEPGTWTYQVTDGGTQPAAGSAGVRMGKGSLASLGGSMADDFFAGVPGDTFTPSSLATGFTLTGPAVGRKGVASAPFTLTPTGGNYTGTLTPTDAAGGTFSPATLTWAGDAAAKTCTLTRSGSGAGAVNATGSPALTPPADVAHTTYAVALAPGSQSVAVGVAASLTATLTGGTGTLAATTTAGTLSTAAPASGTPFTLTQSSAGTATVTVTHGVSGATATATVAATAAPATALTLAGPALAPVGAASANYTVAADGVLAGTLTVTPHSTVVGDTFSPATVTISSGSPTATFTLIAVAAGSRTVTATASGLTGSPGVTTAAAAVTPVWCTVAFPGAAGAVGYTVTSGVDGSVTQARTTAGVVAKAHGGYGAMVSFPAGFFGWLTWDDTAVFVDVAVQLG